MHNLKQIINSIKNGQVYSTKKYKLKLNDFLTKVEDDITFLEYLLKNHIEIDQSHESLFDNNIEIAYLYCKYNRYIYSFILSEENLFSKIHDDYLIDHLIKNEKITREIIETIKNHTEIINIIKNYPNSYYYLKFLSNEIVEKLMNKDDKEKYLLEKYFDDEDFIKFIIPLINNEEIIDICNRQNKSNFLKYTNENILMTKMDDNNTLLDNLTNKNIIPEKLLDIPNNHNFIDFLREKNLYDYLKNANEEILLYEISKHKTLLEEIIELGYTPKLNFILHEETIKILFKIKRLDLATGVSEKLLMKPAKTFFKNFRYRKKLLIHYMLDNKLNPFEKCYCISNDELIQILYDYKLYFILSEKVIGNKLLFLVKSNTTLLEVLLKLNLDINIGHVAKNSYELAKVILKCNELELLSDFNLNVLMKNVTNTKTFMDYILENKKKKKIHFNINYINLENEENLDIAKFYICIAKHNMNYLLRGIDESILLKKENDKYLLEVLLDLNSDLTVNRILGKRIKANPQIALILKSRGLEQREINIINQTKLYSKKHLKKSYEISGIGPLAHEAQYFLEKLNKLFLNDGKSDKLIVNSLINGYRQALLINYDQTLNELKKLVHLKEKYPNVFYYLKSDNKTYYSLLDNSVHSKIPTIYATLHETGHLIHEALLNGKTPINYNTIVEKTRNNPETLKKVELFSNIYNEKINILRNTVEKRAESFFENYYTPEKIEKIKKYLTKSKEEKKKEYSNLNLSEEKLNALLEESFTVEEYIKNEKRLFIDELEEVLCDIKYGPYLAIGDILDAIYKGELYDNLLKNADGKPIKPVGGHGVAYFYEDSYGFAEMVANFTNIAKSHNAPKMLQLLENIIGKELFELLNDFYIINFTLNKAQSEDIKKL